MLLNRLPRLHHPLFDLDRFRRASADRFFLAIFGNDPRFERDAVRRFLEDLGPSAVEEVPFTEEPE